MSQQINFYNPKLIKPNDWFSLFNVALIYLVTACLMLLWYQQLNTEASDKEEGRKLAQQQFESTQKQLGDTMQVAQSVVDVKAQKSELVALQEKYLAKQRVMLAFEQTISGKRLHVADYMAGLSHQPVDKLWITGFKLDPFKNYMSLKGRAFKTELIPKYIEALSRESVFKGQQFGGLQIKEVEQANEQKLVDGALTNPATLPAMNTSTTNNGATANTESVNNTPATPSLAQATNLSNKPVSSSQPSVVKTTTVELKPIKLIEFEIKGLDVVPNSDALGSDEVDVDSKSKTITEQGSDKNVGEPVDG